MNGDTPDTAPSDDFPFLGPAVSPRRGQAASDPPDAGELTPPFVGGAFETSGEEAVSDSSRPEAPLEVAWSEPAVEPESEASPGEILWNETTGPAAQQDARLESFPGGDWPADDFPWLDPSQPHREIEPEEPWRPTADVDELVVEAPTYSIERESEVQHLSWIGEAMPEGNPPEMEAVEGHGEGVAADTGEVFGVEAFAIDGAGEEAGEFEVDFEPAEESWAASEGWRGGAAGQAEVTEDGATAEGEAVGVDAAAGVDRWDEEAGFRVEDGERAEEPGAGDGEAVDAQALPVTEWETPPEESRVEQEEEEAGEAAEEVVMAEAAAASPDDALGEVADRLERMAQALRSGRPLEGVEQGDPLQLLITGYALGYSQARRSGR